jgi:hypothetical protein
MTLAVFVCLSATAFSQELPAWVKNMKFSGDFGARTEIINDEKTADPNDRVRERMRFRLGVDTSPMEKVSFSLGVETSGNNPTSAWVTPSEFKKQPLYLGHAYVSYRAAENLTISGGMLKSSVPFWNSVQLVWKSDVNPYGVAANVTADLPGGVRFFANGGLFALTEYRDYERQVDVPMNVILVVQPGVETKKGRLSAKGALSVQQFSLVNHNTADWIKSNVSFTLIDPSWDVSYKVGSSYAANFSGEFSKNVNANADRQTVAYLLSMGFGNEKINRFKAWQVKAAYRRLENNAIPIGMGQTSAYDADPGRGWEYFGAFGLHKSLAVNATFYNMTDLDGNRPQLVGQLDVIYKF